MSPKALYVKIPFRQAPLGIAYIVVTIVVIVGVYALIWLWQVKSLGVTINWTGVLLSVEPGTSAATAGLRPGDYVRFEDFQRLKEIAGEASVGQLVNTEVARNGEWRAVTLEATASSLSRLLGLSVEAGVGTLFALLGIAPLIARRRGFSLWLFFVAVELTALYLITDIPRAYHQLWAEVIAYSTLPLFPAAVFHFHTLFPEPRLGRWRRPLVVLVYTVAVVLLPFDLVSVWDYGFYVSDGWQYVISVYQSAVLLACVGFVLRAYATNRDPKVRRQLRTITICIAVGLLIPALVVVPVVMFDLDTSDTLKSMAIFAALIVPAGYAYSMVRYKLLIGGLLWRPGLIRIIYTSLLSLGLVAFVVFALERETSLTGNASLIAWTGMVLFVVALAVVHDRLGQWTEKHLFKGASYVEFLALATDELARFRNLTDFVGFFTQSFPTRLRSIGALVFLANSSDGSLRLQGRSPGLHLQVPEEEMPPIEATSDLRGIIEAADGPIALSTLLVPQAPELSSSDESLLRLLRAARVEWLLSLVSTQRPQLVGMVALGAKETDEPYSAKEISALSTLIRTASISAENVLMFETLQNRVTELDLEREFSATLARNISEAQEKERSRISNDIHDTVLQDLSISMQMLARLRDRLQQALGALEDTETALERSGRSLKGDRQPDGHTSAYSEAWGKLRDCESILGSLLGESDAELRTLVASAEHNQTPGKGPALQLERLPDITGKYLVEDVLFLVRSTSQRLREICTDLHPPYLDAPLIKTLSRSIQKLGQISPGVRIDLMTYGEEPTEVGNNLKYLCKKIAEQAVYNALSHAAPSRIVVEVTFSDRQVIHSAAQSQVGVSLCVTDNGTGFEPRTLHQWRSTQHHGLANMYETATLIGGTLEIKSAPGKGMKVSLLVPSAEGSARANGAKAASSAASSAASPVPR